MCDFEGLAWPSITQHSHRCSAFLALFSIAGNSNFTGSIAMKSMASFVYPIHSIIFFEPIRLIETCTFSFLGPILILYSTFNRDIHKIYQPIRLIESILYTYNRDPRVHTRNHRTS